MNVSGCFHWSFDRSWLSKIRLNFGLSLNVFTVIPQPLNLFCWAVANIEKNTRENETRWRLCFFKAVVIFLRTKVNFRHAQCMTFVTKRIPFFAHLYDIDFPKNCQIFFYKIVNKIPNPLPLRIVAVINRVLIFRGLKSGNR